MKLGTLSIENNLLLAPMQEVTTAPYRRFCRKFQKIGLVCVPMIYIKKIEKDPNSFIADLYKIEEEKPISIQLIGSDPEALKKTIIFLESYKFNVLDINAGCPSKRAVRAKEGGFLIQDLDKLDNLINTALKFSSRPVSLKIRIGVKEITDLNKLIKVVNNSALEFLIVHGRTVKNKFDKSQLDLETIKSIKERLHIPVIGNGDIDDPSKAKMFLDYTDVDALMIGRGSMGNPEIFNQISYFLKREKYIPFKNNVRKMQKNIQLYEDCIDELINNEFTISYSIKDFKFKELKRNSIWLTKNIEDSTFLRKKISNAKNLRELKEILQKIYKNN
ncbi:MAG: tRNA dihydrouridine synthase [Promethearchaeota archaeon]|jgi:nifR3 family TIM-barrel protein